MFRNLYWAWDGSLDPKFCDFVLSNADWKNKEEGKVNNSEGRIDPSIRVTEVVWEEIQSPITALAYQHIMIANELSGWNFDIKYPQKTQLGRYIDGGHYDWHIDCFLPDESNLQRKLSCSILLNDASEYEGGKLEIDGIEGELPTRKGSIVVFPSFLRHRVTPVTSGERFSAVCWALGPAFK